jgi:hypothetical protein
MISIMFFSFLRRPVSHRCLRDYSSRSDGGAACPICRQDLENDASAHDEGELAHDDAPLSLTTDAMALSMHYPFCSTWDWCHYLCFHWLGVGYRICCASVRFIRKTIQRLCTLPVGLALGSYPVIIWLIYTRECVMIMDESKCVFTWKMIVEGILYSLSIMLFTLAVRPE